MKILNTVVLTIFMAAILVAAYFVVRFQAIDACLKIGQAQFKNEAGYSVSVPDDYWYKFCMKEKGLK